MAAQSDGSIILDAGIDTEGFERGSEELRRATERLSRGVEQTGKKIQSAVSAYGKALATGSVQDIRRFSDGLKQAKAAASLFRTELEKFEGRKFMTDEYKEIQSHIDNAQKSLDRLLDRQKRMDALGVKHTSQAYQNLAYDIQQAELRLKEVNFAMRNYLNDAEKGGEGGEGPFYGADTAQIDAYSDALKHMEQAISPVRLALSSVAVTAQKTGEAIAKMAGAAVLAGIRAMGEAAAEAARNLTSMTSRAIVSGVKRLGAWLSNAARSMLIFRRAAQKNNGVLKRGFTTILRYGFGIRSLYFLFNKIRKAIKEGFENLAKYSDETNKAISGVISSFSRFKNQFAGAFAPIVNIAAPALAKFINLLSEATFRAGELFAALSGKKAVIKAKEVEEDYAESLKNEKEQKAELREETRAAIAKQSEYAETTDESAESLDDETQAAKNLKRQLAGFDELNILKVDKEDETKPEDLFETVPIDFETIDLAGKIKEMWRDLDLSELGDILGGKIKFALEDIPWEKIKQGASNLGKRLASFLNGLIDAPELSYILGFTLADALNSAFEFLDSFARTFDWKGLGNAVMSTIEGFADGLDWNLINRALQAFATGIADLLNTIFNRETAWEKIGVTLGKALNAVVNAGIAFLEKFNFKQAARAIVIGLNAAIRTVEWDKIGRLLALFFAGALEFLHTAVKEFDWKGLADGIATGLNAFVATMREKIKDLNPREVGEAIGQFINDCFAGIEWGDFGTLVGKLFGGAFGVVATAIRALKLADIVQAIQDFFSNALRQIDFYDILTVWGVASLITAVNAIIRKHPVLALLSAAVMALGPELGAVINRMIETIPWAEVGRNLGNFLVSALNRLHEAIKSVDWFSLGKSVGQFLGNVNWSEIVNSVIRVIGDLIVAGFQTLGGIIVGMGPTGIANALWALAKAVAALIVGGSLLTILSASVKGLLSSLALTITSGITGLSLPIAGAITSLMGIIAPMLSGLGALAAVGTTIFLTMYNVGKLREAQGAFVDAYETHNREIKTALGSLEKLYQDKGPKIAAEWAKACYDIDISGMELAEAQEALREKIDSLWKDAPENLAQGFWQGLKSYFGNDNGFLSNLDKLLGDAWSGIKQYGKDFYNALFHPDGVEKSSKSVEKSMNEQVVKPVASKWSNLKEKMKKPLSMDVEIKKPSAAVLEAWQSVKKKDKATKTVQAKINGTYTKALASWRELQDAEAKKSVEGVVTASFENAQFMFDHVTDNEAVKTIDAKYGDDFAHLRNEYNLFGDGKDTVTKYVTGERLPDYVEIKTEFEEWRRGDATKFVESSRTDSYNEVKSEFEGWKRGDATKYVNGSQNSSYTSAKADFDQFSNGNYGAYEGITKTISGAKETKGDGAWQTILDAYNNFKNGVGNVAGTVIKTICGTKDASTGNGWDVIVSTYNNFKNGVGNVVGSIVKTISGAKDGNASTGWDAIVNAYNNFKNGVGSVTGSITKTIFGAKDGNASTGWQAIVDTYNNFKNGVGNVVGNITKTIFGAKDGNALK